VSELLLLVLQGLGLPVVLALLLTLILVLLERIFADGGVSLGVQVLETISFDFIFDIAREQALVSLLVIIGEGLHVLGNMSSVDVLAKSLGVEFLGFGVVAGESVRAVWNVETTIGSTLHGTKDTGTGGGANETDVQEGLEWAAWLVSLGGFGEFVLTIGFFNTWEVLVELELLQDSAGEEEASGVGGGPIGEAVLDSVALEFVGVGGLDDFVSSDFSSDDLADDVLVGESNDKSVLWSIVLVSSLGDQLLAGIVVGFTLSSALVLHLVSAEVGIVLDKLGL